MHDAACSACIIQHLVPGHSALLPSQLTTSTPPRSAHATCKARAAAESTDPRPTHSRCSPDDDPPPRSPAPALGFPPSTVRRAVAKAVAPALPMLLPRTLSSCSVVLTRSMAARASAPDGPRPSSRCPSRSNVRRPWLVSRARASLRAPPALIAFLQRVGGSKEIKRSDADVDH